MRRRSRTTLAALLTSIASLSGCMSIDVRMTDFMSPDRAPRTAALPRGYAVQDLVIHRGDHLIGLTHAHHPDSKTVIVFCGGDSFHRSIEGGEVLEALALNADVILFDYPGYGDSTGAPSAPVILETALAVYDYAANLETSSGKKRVLYGFSLGGLVAAHVAQERELDGLVLEATAPNVESWARSQIPWPARPFVTPRIEPGLASVDAISGLRRFRGAVLVMASNRDHQAPAALSAQIDRELRAAGVHVQFTRFAHARHGEINRTPEFSPLLRKFLDRLKESR